MSKPPRSLRLSSTECSRVKTRSGLLAVTRSRSGIRRRGLWLGRRHERRDIGLTEVLPFVQKRLAAHRRQRIGETVPVVEPGRVPPLAEPAERPACYVGLLAVHGNDLNAGPLDEEVEITKAFRAESRLDHDRDLDESGSRNRPG